MMRRALVSASHRRTLSRSSSSSFSSAGTSPPPPVYPSRPGGTVPLTLVACSAASIAVGAFALASSGASDTAIPSKKASCDFREDVIHVSNENSEEERFEQCVAYHRCFLDDYRDRWEHNADSQTKTVTTPQISTWPLHVPIDEEVPSLEYDLVFCTRDPETKKKNPYCDDLQFRLASYYLRQDDPHSQKKGFKMVKRLAEMGHGDGMCMYGTVLNDGKIVEANSIQATVWWRRAVDRYRHVQSTYELAVAFYTGEGVPESEELAVYFFEKAATLGHAGAAYMLGDCLLDGVGAPRDRAEALEWLVAAGELGHRGARSRVLAVLTHEDGTHYGRFTDASRQTIVDDVEEESKWSDLDEGASPVSIERRFTIGGGSRNPVVLAKRKSVVAESRSP